MNEQADKLCEGSQRRERGAQGDAGADTVVFGTLNTVTLQRSVIQSGCFDLIWSFVSFLNGAWSQKSLVTSHFCYCLLAWIQG